MRGIVFANAARKSPHQHALDRGLTASRTLTAGRQRILSQARVIVSSAPRFKVQARCRTDLAQEGLRQECRTQTGMGASLLPRAQRAGCLPPEKEHPRKTQTMATMTKAYLHSESG